MSALMTVFVILALIVLGTTIASILNKCPLFVPVLFLGIIELLRVLPLGK
jgi:hypothetical protein